MHFFNQQWLHFIFLIWLKFVPKGPIVNKASVVKVISNDVMTPACFMIPHRNTMPQ